jgi:hypothetical protein
MLMKIYSLKPTWENNILWENYLSDKEKYFSNGFDGSPIINWGEVLIDFENKKMRDFISSGPGMLAFSDKAVEFLMPFLEGNAQMLPVKHHTQNYKLINVTNVKDAINYNISELKKIPTGRLIGINRFVFKEDVIKNQYIFKIPYFVTSYIFVSDSFRQAVIDNKLTGFDFVELWDSEASIEEEFMEPIEWKDPIGKQSMTFSKAMKLAETTGQVFRSGKWRMKFNSDGELEIGEVDKSGKDHYLVLVYIPPILLTQNWFLHK